MGTYKERVAELVKTVRHLDSVGALPNMSDLNLTVLFRSILEKDDKPNCPICDDTGVIEIMGDGPNFEWDVIGHKPCRCQKLTN